MGEGGSAFAQGLRRDKDGAILGDSGPGFKPKVVLRSGFLLRHHRGLSFPANSGRGYCSQALPIASVSVHKPLFPGELSI